MIDAPFATQALNCRFDKGHLEPQVQQALFRADELIATTRRLGYSGGSVVSMTDNDCVIMPKDGAYDDQRIYYLAAGRPFMCEAKEMEQTPISSVYGLGIALGVPIPQGTVEGVQDGAIWTPGPTEGVVDGEWEVPEDEEEADKYDDETRYYCCTFVNEFGQESAPTLPGGRIEMTNAEATCKVSIDPAIFDYASSNEGIRNRISAIRVYRLSTSAESAEYMLCKELGKPFDISHPDLNVMIWPDGSCPADWSASWFFNDDKLAGELGPPLTSLDHDPPPQTDVAGLFETSYGVMLAWDDDGRVYPSETFLPYAYPANYQFSVDGHIRGMAEISSGVIVLTSKRPYIITGQSPSTFSLIEIDASYACWGERNESHVRHIVDMGETVVYASKQGLVALSSSGAQVISKSLFTQEQFAAYLNDDFHAVRFQDKYLAFYKLATGEEGSFVFDPAAQDVVFSDYDASASLFYVKDNLVIYVDRDTNKLMAIPADKLLEPGDWDTDISQHTKEYVWHSKRFVGPETSFSAMRIEGYGFPANPVTVTYITDGQEFTHVVRTDGHENFRLPPWRGRDISVRVQGRGIVERISIAGSMGEL
ncbi:hypothetical protein KUW19_00845 [Ferrimonas balearica]|uniref:hypothetical protein n=1 Tax=Ferrimonas balearica TaxID=44012 RepID=UPI001C96C623|nr:hypothetical protein [Ferrimonas balearica]MBY6105024.1 hypothetical protein [Ferrimonas balearica]